MTDSPEDPQSDSVKRPEPPEMMIDHEIESSIKPGQDESGTETRQSS